MMVTSTTRAVHARMARRPHHPVALDSGRPPGRPAVGARPAAADNCTAVLHYRPGAKLREITPKLRDAERCVTLRRIIGHHLSPARSAAAAAAATSACPSRSRVPSTRNSVSQFTEFPAVYSRVSTFIRRVI